MASKLATVSGTVLGKRKAQEEYILRLTSSPEPTTNDSDHEPPSSNSHPKLIIVNGVLVEKNKKRYKCTFSGCDKVYSKPSRLAEHERTHTGERPFTCETCNKSYFRESHLQAHARSHLPQSARPLACSELECSKRFWTNQHLRVHLEWHNGVKPFACVEGDCHEAFVKQYQLRAHICAVHAPPGTKAYQCDHDGCTKSFATNQHLRTHRKTHDEKRYTCVHSSCLTAPDGQLKYFSTWTALQNHMRTDHPPSCTHPSCNGRIFSCQRNLRAHQKLHALRDLEDQLNTAVNVDIDTAEEEPVPKKRRGGELGRDWKCAVDGCNKDFKSKKALTVHNNVSHLGKKEFECEKCNAKFGYKHLLQRHVAKKHRETSGSSPDESDSNDDEEVNNIDKITGRAYAQRGKALRCPYWNADRQVGNTAGEERSKEGCGYAFGRAYDLQRHVRSHHGVEMSGFPENATFN